MKIGLSQRILHYNNTAYDCLEHGWYNLLSGHTLFCIPNIIDQDYKKIAAATRRQVPCHFRESDRKYEGLLKLNDVCASILYILQEK